MTNTKSLDPNHIIKTIDQLSHRIEERFPDAGLANVSRELLEITKKARVRAAQISRPSYGLRIFVLFVVVAIIALPIISLASYTSLDFIEMPKDKLSLSELTTLIEAGINDIVLIGAAILFLTTIENRIKRRRALKAIHDLRAIAHIIDMHQLTKAPERVGGQEKDTKSSPKRTMDRFMLGRYLDYCSEMLSLTGKVGAIYVEDFSDSEAVSAVNELENLTTGLSRKIWQKIMILHTVPPSK